MPALQTVGCYLVYFMISDNQNMLKSGFISDRTGYNIQCNSRNYHYDKSMQARSYGGAVAPQTHVFPPNLGGKTFAIVL